MTNILKSAGILTVAVLFILIGASFDAAAHGFAQIPAGGFLSGFIHVFGGFDHILALIAVGVWSSQHGGKVERWMPAVFALVMIHGAIMASAGQALPAVDVGMAASVATLGVMLAASLTLRLPSAFFLVSVFAMFHGFSHGTQLAEASDAVGVGAGLIAATILLQGTGIWLGRMIKQHQFPVLARGLGFGCAIAGVFLLAT